MFLWDKSVKSINIPSGKVVHLFRSMREVQMALPGVSAQQSAAYLCQYRMDGGVCTTVVFHLHKSRQLAFYFGDPRVVPEQKTDAMLDQGLNFVESMGFLMTDQDIHLLNQADQEMLWASLPLADGLQDEEESPAAAPARKPAVQPAEKPAEKIVEKPIDKPPAGAPLPRAGEAAPQKSPEAAPPPTASPKAPDEMPVAAKRAVEESPEAADNVTDLLAAVEAMRAKRPGLRARKLPPSPEEMERRRVHLRETIGRILASL